MNALVSAAPIAFAVLLLVPAADTPIAQELTLRIAAPTETTYLSGPSKLVAIIEPQSRLSEVRQVIFFADGKQVCAVTRPPFRYRSTSPSAVTCAVARRSPALTANPFR